MGSLSKGSLSKGVSVQGVSVHWVFLSRGVSVSETPPHGKERAVCILLECFLVFLLILGFKGKHFISSIG